MKREDVKKQIPGITEEQLNWIMAENGNDVNREKTAAEQYKTQLENTQAQLKTAQDGLAAFDGKKKPEEYEADIAKLKGDMQAQAEALPLTMPEHRHSGSQGPQRQGGPGTAGSGCPQGSKDRSTDISKALEEAAKANPWAFGEAAEGGAGSVHVSSGKEHGTPPAGTLIP